MEKTEAYLSLNQELYLYEEDAIKADKYFAENRSSNQIRELNMKDFSIYVAKSIMDNRDELRKIFDELDSVVRPAK